MDHNQQIIGGVYDDATSVGSVESVLGGFIPPVQGVGLQGEQMYMSAEEEIRRTVHAWRGADMPAQSAVSVQDVEALARDAQRALQDTATSAAEDITRLTQETGETFGRVEEAFDEMDSRVESMGTTLQQVQDQQSEQSRRTQATLQAAAILEQRLLQAEERRKEEAAQHAAQLREQKSHMTYLETMVQTEVQAHKKANAALQQATGEQMKLKGEVQDLSEQLQSALDQIHNLSVDLATTRSLLDAGSRRQHGDSGPSTSKGQKWPGLGAAGYKGKKTPSLASSSKKAPSRAGSEGASSRGPSISLRGASDDGASSSSSEEGEDVPRTTWRFLRQRKGHPKKDCGKDRGCGSDAPATQVRFDIKPKDPPVFTGKSSDDVEVWVQQVDNYLQLLGGSDSMQVSYVGTLLQGTAQLWFQRECSAGRRPDSWQVLAVALCDRFSNTTKADQAQSTLMSIRQGKNESAHDFSLRFEAVLDKIPAYDETWVRNLFVWGLHANIAQAVNMKNPRTLNQAMKLAKRADIAVTMSRRPGQKEAGPQDQRKAGDMQASGSGGRKGYWKNFKQNKNQQSGQSGASGSQPQRTGNQAQGNRPGNPQFRGGRFHPAPKGNSGPGQRTTGSGNQRRMRFAAMQPQDQEDTSQVMADQQGQESGQQPDKQDTAASRSQRSGN